MSEYALILKSQENWKARKSGEIDKLNTSCLFETDNPYGFPEVTSSPNFECEDLIPFHICKNFFSRE